MSLHRSGRRPNRWGDDREQLTLGQILALSVEAMDSPGRHILVGVVQGIVSRAPDGTWVAGRLTVEGCATPVPFCGGGLAGIQVGCRVELVGYWEVHPEHGTQLRAERCVASQMPRERDGLVRYLTANVQHLGPARAGKLADHFGAQVLEALEADPERVREVFDGRLGQTIAAAVCAWAADLEEDRWARHTAPRLMMAGGITYALARRITHYFSGAEVADLIARRDPYRLLDVPGIGWKTADRVALSLGAAEEGDERTEAAVGWALAQAMRNGHSALPRAELVARATALLRSHFPAEIESGVTRCIDTAGVVQSGGLLYRPDVLRAEWDVADAFADLAQVRHPLTEAERRKVDGIARRNQLSPEQCSAVLQALENGISVLTGRPGTGKTHTLRAVMQACTALEIPVLAVAPTGKAAARVSEMTSLKGQTIHKLLSGPPGGARKEGPISGCMLVVDEASMGDLETFAWLCRNLAVASGMRLLLVGDHHQLPSVGHGSVLNDVLEAQAFPTTRLTEIRRQAANSRITVNAHALLDGCDLLLEESPDFRFVELPPGKGEADLAHAQELVVRAVRRIIRDEQGSVVRRAGYEERFLPSREIQVLSPRNSGLLGVEALNERLQPILNPTGEEGPRISRRTVRVGDRVLCTRNDYTVGEAGLMNGEQGVVTAVDAAGERVTLLLDDGRTVETRGVQNYLLTHAFCATVHRAQGSEYPFVVVCYHSSHLPLLDVRILYTAVTRARKKVILAADRPALELSRRRGATTHRFTGLACHLRAAVGADA